MEKLNVEKIKTRIYQACWSELDELGIRISMSNTHPRQVGILYVAIEHRREALRLADTMDATVVSSEPVGID